MLSTSNYPFGKAWLGLAEVFLRDIYLITFLDLTTKDAFADGIFDVVLDGTLQWTSTKLNVIALFGNEVLGIIGNGEGIA